MANENVLNEARTIIAGFLKTRRIGLKLSQQDLADRVGYFYILIYDK
jgi:DNA-binding XRE family transcriptional regulator